MFENFNIPFHGMLLDPVIEDSCGPLINYDSSSTFDETTPFLSSPSYVIFSGEYQLPISSNTTFLLTCNFRVEELKHLYPFCSKEYPMKIHYSAFGSSFDFFSSGTCTYAMQPNTLRCETSGFFGCHAMNYCYGCLIHDIGYN
jgi:hypothetical protein